MVVRMMNLRTEPANEVCGANGYTDICPACQSRGHVQSLFAGRSRGAPGQVRDKLFNTALFCVTSQSQNGFEYFQCSRQGHRCVARKTGRQLWEDSQAKT